MPTCYYFSLTFHQFLPIFITLYYYLSNFTIFRHILQTFTLFLPNFTNIYQRRLILITFYQFPPTFIIFYELLPNFHYLLPIFVNFILFFISQKGFYFFSSSDIQQSHQLVGCHATGINSLHMSFSNVLRCLNRLRQVTSLTWIIVFIAFIKLFIIKANTIK